MNAFSKNSATAHDQSHAFAAARYHMIESQLRPNKVRDERVLGIMGMLPREAFVPLNLSGTAYVDEGVEVAPGRFLLAPELLARMLQAVRVGPNDHVLDIAPATGYSTAALSALSRSVVALECDSSLAGVAQSVMMILQAGNTQFELGPLSLGWNPGAPYDVIFINGAVEILPDVLLEQLAEGGRLVMVQRLAAEAAHVGEVRLYEKIGGKVSFRPLFNASAALLRDFADKSLFRF